MSGSKAKKNISFSKKLAKTTKNGEITCHSRHTPWGYPGGVPAAKNHLGLIFGTRLEALTRKSQNLGFERVQFGCLAPSGAINTESGYRYLSLYHLENASKSRISILQTLKDSSKSSILVARGCLSRRSTAMTNLIQSPCFRVKSPT